MSKPVITLPHPDLRKKSAKVHVITDQIIDLVDQMQQSTLDWEQNREHEVGVALAAVQIDELQRVVIIRQNFDDKQNTNFEVFINPKITKYEGEIIEDYEGCLSVKDVYGKVPRHSKVRVKALNLQGKEIRLKAEGFLARVFQHEIDHTNGIVFVDRIKDQPEKLYKIGSSGSIQKLNKTERKNAVDILW